MTYQIYLPRLNAFIGHEFETQAEAISAAQAMLATGMHFSVHPVIDGDRFGACHNGVVGKKPEPLLKTLKWKRSEEGYTETHCGHYSIEPKFNHSTTAQWYTLHYYPKPGDARTREQLFSMCDTQMEAKDRAYRHYNKQAHYSL